MTTNSFIAHLACSHCGERYDFREVQSYCEPCNKPLLAIYDLDAARNGLSKSMLKERTPDMWRYRELLPVLDSANIVTFGEGFTPLLPLKRLAEKYGLRDVWVKDEGQMATGSFKARGLSAAVSKAFELGLRKLAIPSAGNAAGALAAYAARAGMESHIFMPKDAPRVCDIESRMVGASVTLIDGLISDCGKLVAEKKAEMGWFDMSTLKEPYRLEGKKTMGLELAEQFDWQLPDVIIYPTGGGTGLIGMWKSFAELREMDWISDKLPRMISVQAEGCEPITRAFVAGRETSEFFENASTVASGLRVPRAFGDALILKALRESAGLAISVTDDDFLGAARELARMEGLFACPEGAATWAALKRLRDQGEVRADERVVLFNTGTGLKYLEVFS